MSSEPVPVEPCKGWSNACSFCDKRFTEWKAVEDEDTLQKIPEKPIAFMFSFESKQGKEVVSIGLATEDCQRTINQKINTLRQQTSQKKLKETKSNILVRWLVLPQTDSKDACTLYAHWCNYGFLPRLVNEWPGIKIMEATNHFQFSTLSKKWCHNTKETVWRKSKPTLAPKAVKKCKWTDTCAFCDSRFSSWVPLSECTANKMAPNRPGFLLIAVQCNKKHKVYKFDSCISISSCIANNGNYVKYIVKEEKSVDGDFTVIVRWMEHNDLEDNDSCLIYAHWYNADDKPSMNVKHHQSQKYETDFGEQVLLKNSKFSYRTRDKQWCFEGEPKAKPSRYSKTKEKRFVQQSIEDELLTDA